METNTKVKREQLEKQNKRDYQRNGESKKGGGGGP